MFTVGQQVVCIDDRFDVATAMVFTALPKQGSVYTVRAVYVGRGKLRCEPGESDGEIGVLLRELVNPPDPRNMYRQEAGFNAARFAPLEAVKESAARCARLAEPASK